MEGPPVLVLSEWMITKRERERTVVVDLCRSDCLTGRSTHIRTSRTTGLDYRQSDNKKLSIVDYAIVPTHWHCWEWPAGEAARNDGNGTCHATNEPLLVTWDIES